MSKDKSDREYDLVVVGATGYTGTITATHIAEHLPTNLKWAIAGRSGVKLEALAAELKKLSPDRLQPAIEIVDVEDKSKLSSLVKKARVCISVVSYHHVGAEVIEACIKNRTDYIDTAGSVLHIRNWIDKYHKAAELAGVVLIHSCGAFSAPQDLLTWASVRELAKKFSMKTKELVLSVVSIASDPSGGTIESMMERGAFGAEVLEKAQQPWYLSPTMGKQSSNSTNFFGMRHDSFLGGLSASAINAVQNRAVIHRTWGLLGGGKDYGPNFQYNEYKKASSTLAGVFQILNTRAIGLLLTIPPLKAIAMMFLPVPGEGPDLEKEKNYRVEMEAVAIADVDDDKAAPKVYSHFAYPGGPYHTTGAFLAQGAASLLYVRKLEGGAVGGLLTPAFLGADLIERIQGVGAELSTKIV
ncbi:hypothetical protein VE01_02396 [Pseudogymnoascus verrucosus]|uniref:Saccharopine dehydrogenase NADP binding domain-containing protein n=1 Tax=Pseudogymnoascus verrucosus TaxID=342668 RepID=A0A1B8GSU3_9PEZI|nr:uncharacterized protein VE01_02396 [Pseudogymnoascus verrucosus]OBT98898.1 hypothetical protein VE01_02396 [Pseudogymnoascus verrucosus]